MNPSWKKALVILVGAAVIFLIFKPKKDGEKGLFSGGEKREPMRKPVLSEEALSDERMNTAYQALCAYVDAYNDGMDEAGLEKLKTDFKSQMGIVLYEDENKKMAARDTNGNDILYY